jgi:hypothetical protein
MDPPDPGTIGLFLRVLVYAAGVQHEGNIRPEIQESLSHLVPVLPRKPWSRIMRSK